MPNKRTNGPDYGAKNGSDPLSVLEARPAIPVAVNDAYQFGAQAEMSKSLFMRCLEVLQRWRRGFLLFSAVGLLAAIGITAVKTPMYQAHAVMEIDDMNEDFLNMKQVTPVHETGPFDSITDLETQVRAIESDGLLQHAASRVGSARGSIDSWRPQVSGWRRFIHAAAPEKTSDFDSPEVLGRRMKARILPQTKDVEVSVDSSNPDLAAALANAICDEFIEENVEARWNVSRQTGEWLDRLLKEMRARLAHSEEALQQYAESAGLVFNSDRKSVSDDKLHEIQDELSKARADREAKQARYELVRKNSSQALPELSDDASLTDYESKLTDLKRQAADISTTYTPAYTKLRKLEAQIASLEDSIRQERQDVIQRIENDFWAAARRESLLERDYNAQSRSVSLEAEKGVQYNVLQREVDSNRQAYDTMLQRAQEATIAAGMRASNVRMVDPASAPKVPYKPSLMLNLLVGLFFGMMLGSVYVLVRESTDAAFRHPGDGVQYLNVAELGFIVHLNAKDLPHRSRSSPVLFSAGSNTKAPPLLGSFSNSEAVKAIDSFHGIVTSLRFWMRADEKSYVLTLTSPGPGEGKTTAVANLGLALAEANTRVLLIDGDLRRGKLSTLLHASGRGGLLEVLQAAPNVNPLTYVEQTGVPGLSLLGGDRLTIAGCPLLQSKPMDGILQQLKEHFDVILIDTAPVLTAPDTRILGRSADGVILVTRAGKTNRQAAAAALQRLTQDGSAIVGTIFNDWNPRDSLGSYYPYYHETPVSSQEQA